MRASCERDCCARSRILCFRSGGAPGISDGFQPGVPIRHNKQPGPVGTTGNHIPKIPLCSLVSLWFQKVCSVILLDRIQDGDFLHLKVKMMLDDASRRSKIEIVLWDYKIPAEDCIAVLDGIKQTAGHYNDKSLFMKILESLPWYVVMDIIPMERIRILLTPDTINKLRVEQLRKRYEFIRARLSEAL